MLATLVDEPFDSPKWIYESKFDGLRLIARYDGEDLQLLSRNSKAQNFQFPEIEAALVRGTTLNVAAVLTSLEAGFLRFLDDATNQEAVRRAVLPSWDVLEKRLAG